MTRINLVSTGDLPEHNFPIASFGKGLGNLNNAPALFDRKSLRRSTKQEAIVTLKILIGELAKGEEGVFCEECIVAFDFSWSKCRGSLEQFLDSFSSWKHCGALRHDVYLLSQELQDEVSASGRKFDNLSFHVLALAYAEKVVSVTSKYKLNNLPESINTFTKYFAESTRSEMIANAHSLLLHLLSGYELEWD